MRRMNAYQFFELGEALGDLKNLKHDTLLLSGLFACWEAQRSLFTLLNGPVSFRVCLPAAKKLLKAIDAPQPQTMKTTTDPALTIPQPLVLRITSAVTEFRHHLEAECPTLATYVVSPKGAYSVSRLIDQAEVLIPETTRGQLDDLVTEDIRQAGRCLAFDLPTAAAFHLFRAVESVLRLLHSRVTQTPPADEPLSGWHPHIQALTRAAVPSKVTDLLVNIKNNYRNPIAHPEATLTSDQAIVLVPLGVAAIQAMVDVMPDPLIGNPSTV